MPENDDRVQEALAAHLDHLEMGGPVPDTAHLTADEQAQLHELIAALDSTEGVAFGLGLEETGSPAAALEGVAAALHGQLVDALPPDVRIEADTTTFIGKVGGVDLLGGLIVGTFGGRVRVWALAARTARELEENRDCLVDLNRVFGAFPGTSAVALVAEDMTCLIVRPEDCAPRISLPTGALGGRRYSYPIQPVGDAVAGFLAELIPSWDPIPAFERDSSVSFDASSVVTGCATEAVETQRSSGQRARIPAKKDALSGFGATEADAIARLVNGLLDGSISPEETAEHIDRVVAER